MQCSIESKLLQYLLSALCSQLGLCSATREVNRFIALGPKGREAFLDAVFRVEGLDPSAHKELWEQASNLAATHVPQWQSVGRQ